MIDVALIQLCAPHVAAATIQRVVQTESAGDIYALNVNGYGRVRTSSPEETVATAERLIDEGYSVDLGLMQINSRHLTQLHLTVAQAFEPCTNLKAGAKILQEAYQQAAGVFGPGQRALQAALSTYNTGDPSRGLANGYVSQVYAAKPATPAPAKASHAYAAPTLVSSSSWAKETPHVP
jgi:type IV secretion system protein VirB1